MKKLSLLLTVLFFFNTSALDSCTTALIIPPVVFSTLIAVGFGCSFYQGYLIKKGKDAVSQQLIAEQGEQTAENRGHNYSMLYAALCGTVGIGCFAVVYIPLVGVYCNKND